MNNLKINCAFFVQKQFKKFTFALQYIIESLMLCATNMKLTKTHFLLFQLSLIVLGAVAPLPLAAQDVRYTVVLDAGHGGHDPGAMGSFAREKDINLDVTLKLGQLIEKNFNEVKVVFTRKTDKYLTLQERADIVNNNHADLFICIHTNASKSSAAYGAETFTLGLAKSKSNLDVAMRENSVILLEDDYKSKYRGFDPNSVDSYIMFEFMQGSYIDNSVEFSSIIQNQFVKYCRRSDRGVRQAGFWVLHRSACPSVLIELGFISNPAEERYLSSEVGQKEMATAIYNAFVDFKRTHDKKSGLLPNNKAKKEIAKNTLQDDTLKDKEKISSTSKIENIAITANDKSKQEANNKIVEPNQKKNVDIVQNSFQQVVFKVQLFATSKVLKSSSTEFKGIKDTDYFAEKGLNKYTIGAETDYKKIEQIRINVLSKFPQAFIIAFKGDKKLSPSELAELTK